MLRLRILCPGAGQRILHNLFQRGLRSSVCLEGFGSQMNDEDPVVIEREYNKYKKGESHGFFTFTQCNARGFCQCCKLLLVCS